MAIKTGCCGFPESRQSYFAEFPLVEAQQTFYKLPQLETAERWRQQAPAGFEYTMKAWQLITHEPASPTYRKSGVSITPDRASRYGSFRPTQEVRQAWEATLRVAKALGASVVVFQCPARFTPTEQHIEDLRAFFKALARDGRQGLRHAWEPRGRWPADVFAGLCQELELIPCVDPLAVPAVAQGSSYFRLHGIGGYRYRYTDDDLQRLAGLARDRESCYCLFNNYSMLEDARRFRALVAGE
jgi:uncharacterized protein YecE (DUF72 family)